MTDDELIEYIEKDMREHFQHNDSFGSWKNTNEYKVFREIEKRIKKQLTKYKKLDIIYK